MTLTKPGPATEHDSTISEAGRFFKRAYVKKVNKIRANKNLLESIQKATNLSNSWRTLELSTLSFNYGP